MRLDDKPLVWLHSEVKTPPFSREGRLEAGYLLRMLQKGENLTLPYSRPMPTIGRHVHELRIHDKNVIHRIIYRIDSDAIIVLECFQKKTQKTPNSVIDKCKDRIKAYDKIVQEAKK